MKVVGIDLAGNPKNDTGFCSMEVKDDKKHVSTQILHSDSEIIDKLKEIKPELIAIDAPLTYKGVNRKCDNDLQKYGALPVTLRGMEVLAKRGTKLADELKRMNFKFIEVFSTATAKILGFHDKKETVMQKNLIKSGIEGDVGRRFLTKDELDAIFAAMTAYLYVSNSTETIGDDNESIIIPKV
ncbi:MAG: hypothetical protein A7315_04000 [Candidatus Altiarchaeales archaeon WOR_SM1_79]|nr:MAG: hypothetical protein A7315_04000 [Candidatus Altiarchaeales archaeon WOR_SM1_79]